MVDNTPFDSVPLFWGHGIPKQIAIYLEYSNVWY